LAAAAQELPKEICIGYQKSGMLAIAKQQRLLETRFAAQGIAVRWAEFPYGPPLLEALNAGSLDYGYTGDAPPIFAQAARANLLYVAALPARGDNQAIVVLPDSPLKSLQDLKGKKVGVAKASSAHSLVASALESISLPFTDITPVYLAPADAAAAFARGAIDAWSIWDPFLAIAEISRNARRLPIAPEAAAQNSYFLANRTFTTTFPELVAAINEEVRRATTWAGLHREDAAQQFSTATGVDLDAETRSVGRTSFDYGPITDVIIRQQQAVADRFYRLGLLPAPVNVADIVWKWTPTG
jgi:aliphatic sulfonates family ABC transporter substrate-binding protein